MISAISGAVQHPYFSGAWWPHRLRRPTNPWGKDFGDAQGDHGEPDLAAAIAYARSRGKRVAAVVAGHMHHRTQQGTQRCWHLTAGGTAYINAACVPRILQKEDQQVRHHILLMFDEHQTVCEEQLIA